MEASIRISQIIVYPIKSLAGVALQKCWAEERGFRYDRRWMLVDDRNVAITQRDFPQMALLDVSFSEAGIVIQHRTRILPPLVVPYITQSSDNRRVHVWDSTMDALVVGDFYNQWFSEVIDKAATLVYMPDSATRLACRDYAPIDVQVSMADGYPYLLIGQASLDDLNTRLTVPLTHQRFRPNIIVEDSLPYDEDQWYELEIGSLRGYGVKPCVRCILTTVNPETGQKDSKEPIKTLAQYRGLNNKIYFGQNLILAQTGLLSIGDVVRIVSRKHRQTMIS